MLSIEKLTVRFAQRCVLENVSMSVDRGEVLGIVGESGSGKTMTALSVMGLLNPAAEIAGGSIRLDGRELIGLDEKAMSQVRGGEIAMIFQEPMTSLNPTMRIGKQLEEAVILHESRVPRVQLKERVLDALRDAKLEQPENVYASYPHELSGGMRQRSVMAIALASNPDILFADEPTTALDVTIQAQILDLMRKLQKKLNTSIMMITHDLGVIAEMADYVLVMYAGRVMEYCDVHSLFKDPLHPYTQGLISALPNINDQKDRLYVIKGNVPSLYDMPAGCGFWPRCPYATERCKTEVPDLYQIGDRKVRCFLHENRKQVV